MNVNQTKCNMCNGTTGILKAYAYDEEYNEVFTHSECLSHVSGNVNEGHSHFYPGCVMCMVELRHRREVEA